jgi:hypothetical protein
MPAQVGVRSLYLVTRLRQSGATTSTCTGYTARSQGSEANQRTMRLLLLLSLL